MPHPTRVILTRTIHRAGARSGAPPPPEPAATAVLPIPLELVDPSPTVRILLIDDDQGDFEMTRAMVRQIQGGSMRLDWVSSFQEGMDAIQKREHDVYLVDYLLEDRDGLELVRWARDQGSAPP